MSAADDPRLVALAADPRLSILADRTRDLMLDMLVLVAARIPAAVTHYNDGPDPLSNPPGRSPRAFAAACRRGDHPRARKSGRRWILLASDYEADLARVSRPRSKPRAAPITPPVATDSVDSLLAAGGLRLRAGGGSR